MRILVQIENGNQKLFTAIKALLNAQPNLKFKIEKFNKISYIPNDETIKAMQECEQGKGGEYYDSLDDFFKEASIPALDEAIAEFENGDVIKCGSFKEYQRKMRE